MAVAGGKVKKGNLNLQAKDMITDVNMLDVRIGSNEQTADKISQHFSFLDAKIEAMKQVFGINNYYLPMSRRAKSYIANNLQKFYFRPS